MDQELTFVDLVDILKKNFFLVLMSGLVLGGLTFGICAYLPTWYAHSLILRSPQTGSGSDSPPISAIAALRSSNTPITEMKAEAIAFLKLEFVENPAYTENSKKVAFAKKVSDIKGTDLIEVTIYGRSPKDAAEFTNEITSQLQKNFDNRISAALSEKKDTLALSQKAQDDIKSSIQNIDQTINEVGFSAALVEKKAKLMEQLFMIGKQIITIDSLIQSGAVHPVQVASSRPSSAYPAFPNLYYPLPFILPLAGFLAGILLSWALAIYSHLEERKNIATAGAYNEVPVELRSVPPRKIA